MGAHSLRKGAHGLRRFAQVCAEIVFTQVYARFAQGLRKVYARFAQVCAEQFLFA